MAAKNTSWSGIVLSLFLAAACGLSAWYGLLDRTDTMAFDILLGLRTPVAEDPRLVALELEPGTVVRPEELSGALLALKELGVAWLSIGNAVIPPNAGDLRNATGFFGPQASMAGPALPLEPDADGVLRRVDIMDPSGTSVMPHPPMAALLDLLGNAPLQRVGQTLVIKRSAVEEGRVDMAMPLDQEGRMVLNWGSFAPDRTYHLLGLDRLRELADLEARLFTQVEQLHAAGAPGFSDSAAEPAAWARCLDLRDQALASGKPADLEAWLDARAAWFKAVGTLLQDSGETGTWKAWKQARQALENQLEGAWVMVNLDPAGRNTRYRTPRGYETTAAGAYLAMANTVVQGSFVTQAPPLAGILPGAAMVLFLALMVRGAGLPRTVMTGLFLTLLATGATTVLFLLAGIFVGPSVLVIDGLAATLLLLALGLWRGTGRSRRIRTVLERVAGPALIRAARASGDPRLLEPDFSELTVLVARFSDLATINGARKPGDLVETLNKRFAMLARVVQESGGCVARMDDAALVAFWGAPLVQPDHEERACRAAVRMRDETGLPLALGIDAGPMLVGCMGIAARLDYGIMGEALTRARLAACHGARTGSVITVTERVRARLGDSLPCRSLERVYLDRPAEAERLHEVLAGQAWTAALPLWEKGLALMEIGHFKTAAEHFKSVLALVPDDQPARRELERCEAFLANPPPHGTPPVEGCGQP